MRHAKRFDLDFVEDIDPEPLGTIRAAALGWLDVAEEARRAQVLASLQIKVEARKEEATVSGVIPSDAPELITTGRTAASPFNNSQIACAPFHLEIPLSSGADSTLRPE